MKIEIKKLLREALLKEKLMLKDWDEYVSVVANAYEQAPDYDASVVKHWKALNASNYTLFTRLLSKVNVIFTTNDSSKVGSINILGRKFKIEFIDPDDEYKTQSQMKQSFNETGILKISCDYSDHPIFSVADNIVFRTVHDYIVHILGNHDFGAKGEIASYNRHAKLAPKEAIPAIFTEVLGQAAVTVTTNSFPKQKIAVLHGFDFVNVGVIDDENYTIVDKTLVKKSEVNNLPRKEKQRRAEPIAIKQPEPMDKKQEEPSVELSHYINKKNNLK